MERALDAAVAPAERQIRQLPAPSGVAVPVGRSRAITQLRSELMRLAAYSAPLLLLGESGTDRERLARFVHQSGPTSAGPFVVVDSRTLREDTAAATLLGVDASQPGKLEQARRGTLFLGDIEDLPESTQRLLGGLLESGRFVRGGGEAAPLETRIISSARPGIVIACWRRIFAATCTHSCRC